MNNKQGIKLLYTFHYRIGRLCILACQIVVDCIIMRWLKLPFKQHSTKTQTHQSTSGISPWRHNSCCLFVWRFEFSFSRSQTSIDIDRYRMCILLHSCYVFIFYFFHTFAVPLWILGHMDTWIHGHAMKHFVLIWYYAILLVFYYGECHITNTKLFIKHTCTGHNGIYVIDNVHDTSRARWSLYEVVCLGLT